MLISTQIFTKTVIIVRHCCMLFIVTLLEKNLNSKLVKVVLRWMTSLAKLVGKIASWLTSLAS